MDVGICGNGSGMNRETGHLWEEGVMKWVYCQEVVILVTVSSSKLLGDNFELAHWIMKREHVTIHVRDTRIDQFMFEFGRPFAAFLLSATSPDSFVPTRPSFLSFQCLTQVTRYHHVQKHPSLAARPVLV